MKQLLCIACSALMGVMVLTAPGEGVAASTARGPVFLEADGVVVIEAESTASKPGKWTGKTDIEGYTGKGHIEYTGNKPAGGQADSPMVYYFKINKAGTYRLHLRAHKRLEGEASDKCNDAYVRVVGDYGATDKAGDKHNDDARLEDLKKDTKCFGGLAKGWGWAETLDLGGHQNKRMPRYVFKAGETYALVISGRSQRFNIDRVVFCHESVDVKRAKDPERAESQRE
ncbi:MAG: hypothetical protein ACE37H_06570 [Phycisphaeraceae bacterium]